MPSNAAKAAPTVLLIDDDELVRQSIAAYLSDSGFHLLQADDGPSGMEMAQRLSPDVVLLDLRMPEMDGLEVLDRLRQAVEELPVIVVTGAGVLKDAVEALRMGAFDFISKPIVDMAILEHSIHKALERTRLRSENRQYHEHLEAQIRKRTHDLELRTSELERSNRRLQSEMLARRRTECALQQSRSQLGDIIAVFEGYIYTVNRSYELQFINPRLMASAEQARPGGICHRCLYERADPCPWCPLPRVWEGLTVRVELTSTRDGRWYYGIYSPQENAAGRIEGCQAIVIDIHERKQAEEALRQREAFLREQNERLRSSLQGTVRFGNIIGKSPAMHRVYRTILKAAGSNANVIIYGESGTGKELVARTIHELSDRGSKPFVPVNCGAIPENLIESEFFGYQKGAFTGAERDKAGFLSTADGGTLFLDEVGEINPNLQIKLLRAIDGGGFTPLGSNLLVNPDIRIIAATNRDLAERIQQGHFRKDFYYRIHVIPMALPPLRERREDIPLLIQHFLQIFGGEGTLQSIPHITMNAMQKYQWPGNVRELQNAVRQYIALQEMDVIANLQLQQPAGTAVDDEGVISAIGPDKSLSSAVQHFERRYIEHMLDEHKWHRSKVAGVLGIDRRTLFRKMKEFDLL